MASLPLSRQYFDNSFDGADAAIQDIIAVSGSTATFDINIPASVGDNAGVLVQWAAVVDGVTLSSATLGGVTGSIITGAEAGNASSGSVGAVFFPLGDTPTSGDRLCTLNLSAAITASNQFAPETFVASAVIHEDVEQTGQPANAVADFDDSFYFDEGFGILNTFETNVPDQYCSLFVVDTNNSAAQNGTTAGSGFVANTSGSRPGHIEQFDQLKALIGSQETEVFTPGSSSTGATNIVVLQPALTPSGAFPEISNVSVVNDSVEQNGPKTTTLDHDHNGDGPVRLVAFFSDTTNNNASVTTSATYNGVAMTEVERSPALPSNFRDDLPNARFYELAGAATGVNEFSFTVEIGTALSIDAVVLIGISAVGDDGTGDAGTAFSSANLTTLNPSLTTEENDSLVLSFFGIQGADVSGNAFTPGAGHDQIIGDASGASGVQDFSYFVQQIGVATAGAQDCIGTWTPGDDSCSLSFEIKRAAGAPPATVDLGAVARASTVQPLGLAEQLALGTASRTSTVEALAVSTAVELGNAARSSTVQPVAISEDLELQLAARTSTVQPLAPSEALPIGVAARVSTVNPLAISESIGLGTVARSSAVQGQAQSEQLPIGTAARASVVQGIILAQQGAVALGTVARTQAVQSLAVIEALGLGTASRSSLVQGLGLDEELPLGTVARSSTVQAVTLEEQGAIALGAVLRASTVQPLIIQEDGVVALGSAVRSSAVQPIALSEELPIGTAARSSAVQGVATTISVAIGTAARSSTVQPLAFSQQGAIPLTPANRGSVVQPLAIVPAAFRLGTVTRVSTVNPMFAVGAFTGGELDEIPGTDHLRSTWADPLDEIDPDDRRTVISNSLMMHRK